MLTQWLTRLEPIHVATTREELDAVYRFRYTVYYEEYGRQIGDPDHERRMVTDPHDEADFSTILYSGTPEDVTGTVRLRHWAPGEVPEYELRELSMDLFDDVSERHTAEIGRFMIRKSLRGRLLLAAFAREAYDLLCGEKGSELAFCYCAPGLVHYYRKLGARPFGGRLVHTPDGMMVPLVSVLSDHGFYRRSGSPLAPLVRRHFGRGKRPVIDVEPYRHLFENESAAIELDAEKIWGEIQEAVTEERDAAAPFLQSLPEPLVKRLTEKGFILQVDAGTMITRQGYGEEEMYLILDGLFEAVHGDRRLALMGKGELFGEVAFFVPGHRRTATVNAVSDGRVLALRGRTLRQLIDDEPALAARLLFQIGRVMAERLATAAGAVDEDED